MTASVQAPRSHDEARSYARDLADRLRTEAARAKTVDRGVQILELARWVEFEAWWYV